MVIEFDLSGQCESSRNRKLQAWSQNMHESTDEGDHPAPSSFRVIVSAQQLFRLHLRVVFRLNSRDVAFVYATISFRRMNLLLQGRIVNRTASFTCRVQQRPGSRTEYRHHRWKSDFFRGYVPVSLPIVLFVYTAFVYIPVARIGTAWDRARFIRNMLPIVSTAVYVLSMRFFFTTTARQCLSIWQRTKRTCCMFDTVSGILRNQERLFPFSRFFLLA